MKALSTDLTYDRHPLTCQACGLVARAADELTRWMEHDENDKPLRVIVVLCGACAKRLINPHPRLYAEIARFRPIPGSLDLCVDCECRQGLDCTHPDLKANGGPGLRLEYPDASTAHVCGSGPNGRWGKWIKLYSGPATSCAGRKDNS